MSNEETVASLLQPKPILHGTCKCGACEPASTIAAAIFDTTNGPAEAIKVAQRVLAFVIGNVTPLSRIDTVCEKVFGQVYNGSRYTAECLQDIKDNG